MNCVISSKFGTLELDLQPLGGGKEGAVYRVLKRPNLLVKVFTEPTALRKEKVDHLLSIAPAAAIDPSGHSDASWPLDSVIDPDSQAFCGYVMFRLPGELLATVVNPIAAPKYVNRKLRWRWAVAILEALSDLHAQGIFVGDINPNNILANKDGRISLIDLDSASLTLPCGQVLPCEVGMPDWQPPELQNVNWSCSLRGPEQDVWGGMTAAFMLICDGHHPFQGVYHGAGPVPSIPDRIRDGLYPYSRCQVGLSPPPTAEFFPLLTRKMRKLFRQTFEIGHADPTARPSAAEAASVIARCAAADNATLNRLRRCFLLLLVLPRPTTPRSILSHLSSRDADGFLRGTAHGLMKAVIMLALATGLVGGGHWLLAEKPWSRWSQKPEDTGLPTPALWDKVRHNPSYP
jgi:DNA-binding helix-hairpin-helix protein with protein kinase domain